MISGKTSFNLLHSSSCVMGDTPGAVDSAPTSITAAPCSIRSVACLIAALASKNLPPSENEFGVTFNIPTIFVVTAEYCKTLPNQKNS
ncbi:hypothetical protein ANAPH1_00175 [Anaplasma phagocytophilum]|nr:hypothetical protein ANAPH1_00175 [Anaplasma phagocytophilum]SCV66190.1 hypothetical protein ANAPH2_01509 [Anaplasma phagocytophilum]